MNASRPGASESLTGGPPFAEIIRGGLPPGRASLGRPVCRKRRDTA